MRYYHNKYKTCILIIIITFLTSCISDYEGVVPFEEPMPVLNGILFADSIITVNLSWSAEVDYTAFRPISNANITLFQNRTETFTPVRTDSLGNYYFPVEAKTNAQYNIEVFVAGYDTIIASTSIPGKPDITYILNTIDNTWGGESPIFKFDIQMPHPLTGALYFFPVFNLKHGNYCSFYCNSALADQFNAANDSWGPAGFNKQFETFIRFNSEDLPDSNLIANIALSGSPAKTTFKILNTTEAFDLYYKGSYLQRVTNCYDETSIPIAYQPLFLPTNVSNGIGIFAGVNQTKIEFNFE